MKKIFNYALLAAALLVGVNVNAGNVAKVAIEGGATTEYATLAEAFGGVGVGETATITMLDNAEISAELVVPEQAVITWDLAEKVVTINHQVKVIHTSLSIEGKGQITGYGWAEKFRMFYFEGSDTDNCGVYTYFKVGPDVSIECGDGYVMAINSSANPKHAFGLQIDIAGYLYAHAGPVNTPKGYTFAVVTINGGITDKTGTNLPEIWLRSTGTFLGDGMGIYGAGYAIWHIYGRCEGALGIYIKSGEWDIDGATIVANATSHDEVTPNPSGSSGGDGTGIVIDSHDGYGKIGDINIANSIVISNATGGYAIEEVATQGGTKLPDISIESGTFVGGITTTTEERQHIIDSSSITGGEWHNSDIDEYIDKDNYTTLDFVDGEGKQYQIVVPIKEADWAQSIAAAKVCAEGKKYAYVKADEIVPAGKTVVEFVRIAKGTTVTVATGATLDAGTLMTEGPSIANPGGETGKIIVEAGGTLIVSGKQGAYTYNENSLVVKASQASSGQILINPAVVLNTTPKATVEFVSNSCKVSDGVFIFQYFGIPMTNVTSVVSSDNTNMTYFDVNRAGTNWQTIGNITAGVVSMNYALFDTPFGFYQIQSNNKANEDPLQTYTFKGNLFGNTSPKLSFHSGWPGFSNAYMGITDFNALTKLLEEQGHDASVYVYTQIEGTNTLVWDPYNKYLAGEDVKPMNAFMLRNAGAAKQFDLDYTKLVWNPARGIEPNNAPRLTELSKVGIRVNAANGVYDQVTLLEGDIFTSDYDNGADAEKYMNSEMNLYVKGEKDLAIMASDNVENTYIAFNCKNAGRYTMTFNRLQGEGFVIVDTKTNAHIAMAEGTTYEFIADAGEDAYRFMIVRGAQAPTEMQKTDAAVKANKALVNGQIVISNGERFFNVLGTEVK